MDILESIDMGENYLIFTDLVVEVLSSGKTLAVAESCTGGMICALITSVPGSSDWFKGGIIAYSNEAKQKTLGVDPELIDRYGAVSEETARAMAQGVRLALGADCTVAVTGIAGPGGATLEKKVGTVCFAWDLAGKLSSDTKIFSGNRKNVRMESVRESLAGLLHRLGNEK